ncbi:MAG TPA: hypothetical protein VK457_18255 [Chloroflexota bacterium]|nr:hypothetical protein [Chloroflexota bacterium]
MIADLEPKLGHRGAVGELEGVVHRLADLAALHRSRTLEAQTAQAVRDPQQAQACQDVQANRDLEQRLPGNSHRKQQQDGRGG